MLAIKEILRTAFIIGSERSIYFSYAHLIAIFPPVSYKQTVKKGLRCKPARIFCIIVSAKCLNLTTNTKNYHNVVLYPAPANLIFINQQPLKQPSLKTVITLLRSFDPIYHQPF